MSDLDRQATGVPEAPEPPSEHFACRGCGKNTMQFEDGGWEHEANCLALKLDKTQDMLRAIVLALKAGNSADDVLETIGQGVGITEPPK